MGELSFVCRTLEDHELARLRARAFADGMVIERDGLAVLGLGGVARLLRLPNGLADPFALDNVVRELRAIRLAGPDEPGERLAGVEAPKGRPHRHRTSPLSAAGHAPGDPARAPSEMPLAMGAFKFLPAGAAHLVVPVVTVIATEGRAATALVTGEQPGLGPLEDLLLAPPVAEEAPPDAFALRSARPHDDFRRRVADAVAEVRSGRLEKVVMAREVVVEANRPFRQADLLERLRSLHPSCMTFALGGFLGASPELLVRREGRHVESHPLAGTAPRSGDPAADRRTEAALINSPKERAEHRAVVEAIAAALSPATDELEVPEGPEIVELRNVSHLRTRISGTLATGPEGRAPTALDVVALIHPTPAVAGTPLDLALDYLDKAEELDRDRYAGAAGWVRADGDGEWYLGIRCALVDDRTARLFAGVGIVGDSDPAAELAETQLKLQAFLAAAVRP
jgi:menaquinone-specific isochorismate synthase